MNSRIKRAFEHELERRVEKMFEQAQPLSGARSMAEMPIVGGCFFKSMPYDGLVLQVCAALTARQQFRTERPDWPALPLRETDCDQMMGSDDNHKMLVGFFGCSLRLAYYQDHPCFDDYASGLMAYEYTPRKLRSDVSLQREFPPRRLEGLCDGWLAWRDPETIASHRYHHLRPPHTRRQFEVIRGSPPLS